ncbi:Sodium-dependent dicarboxylate transporter SdcS [bacterium HR18]|nr:Sodium-dependent dicarboxylate transporter SdcS [bacterium HR18]
METLGWQAWVTLAAIIAMVVALVREVARPDLIFLGTLGLLLLSGVLTPKEAFAGFSNEAVLTVAALFVVAAGLQRTEALAFLDRLLFPRKPTVGRTILRMGSLVAALSGFLNNTPIVAMLMPRVQRWAERHDIAPSKLLIPLSYATVAGGMITLIGTSTNLVVSGLLMQAGLPGLRLFDLTWVGLPVAVVVVLFLGLFGHRLLPNRKRDRVPFDEGLRECLFELRVTPGGRLEGKTIEEAGLRALGEAYLVHIRRSGRVIPAAPEQVLQGGDILVFVGAAQMIDRLLEREGLERALASVEENPKQALPLFEAVVAPSSNLVGKTLREVQFREHYGGVVLGIQRQGQRIMGSLGRIPIQAGDLLLIEARNGFDRRWNARRDEFYLVAPRRGERPRPRPRHAPVALAVFVGMVLLAGVFGVSLVTAAFTAALGMIATRCLSGSEARQALDMQVLVVIAAALGLGQAVSRSGLADFVGHGLVVLTASLGPLAAVGGILLATMLLTELLANNAAAALMVPIALSVAGELGLEPRMLAIVVAIGASAGFMTPFGYQTNLMVMSAGGYRFMDYVKAGAPVSMLVFLVSLIIIALRWL